MSIRSMLRPSTRNRQPSSRASVASASPASTDIRSRTCRKNSCGIAVAARFASVKCAVLSTSHISDEIASRAPRAFSHATSSDATIEPGLVGANASWRITASASRMSGTSVPIARSSALQITVSSANRSSSRWW